MIDTILGYDALGGGVLTVVAPTSLTIKADGYLFGYFLDGISVQRCIITNPANTKWDPTGLVLFPTTDGTAVGAGVQWQPLKHRVPVKEGDVLIMTGVSGANPMHCGLYVDYEPFSFKLRPDEPTELAYAYTRATVPGGTNCAAGTLVQSATNLTSFPDRILTPVKIHANAAFTTTAMIGIRKLGTGVMFILPIGLTDVTNDWWSYDLPLGLFTVTKGSSIELFWCSVTAEQPTAQIDFAYPVPAT
jgi:hypothetical protein